MPRRRRVELTRAGLLLPVRAWQGFFDENMNLIDRADVISSRVAELLTDKDRRLKVLLGTFAPLFEPVGRHDIIFLHIMELSRIGAKALAIPVSSGNKRYDNLEELVKEWGCELVELNEWIKSDSGALGLVSETIAIAEIVVRGIKVAEYPDDYELHKIPYIYGYVKRVKKFLSPREIINSSMLVAMPRGNELKRMKMLVEYLSTIAPPLTGIYRALVIDVESNLIFLLNNTTCEAIELQDIHELRLLRLRHRSREIRIPVIVVKHSYLERPCASVHCSLSMHATSACQTLLDGGLVCRSLELATSPLALNSLNPGIR